MATHYTVLGVEEDATQDEIRRAYRTWVRENGADKWKGKVSQYQNALRIDTILKTDEAERSQTDQEYLNTEKKQLSERGKTFEDYIAEAASYTPGYPLGTEGLVALEAQKAASDKEFVDINLAYEVLSNPRKRKDYDELPDKTLGVPKKREIPPPDWLTRLTFIWYDVPQSETVGWTAEAITACIREHPDFFRKQFEALKEIWQSEKGEYSHFSLSGYSRVPKRPDISPLYKQCANPVVVAAMLEFGFDPNGKSDFLGEYYTIPNETPLDKLYRQDPVRNQPSIALLEQAGGTHSSQEFNILAKHVLEAIQHNNIEELKRLLPEMPEKQWFRQSDYEQIAMWRETSAGKTMSGLCSMFMDGKPLLHYATSPEMIMFLDKYHFSPLSVDSDQKTFIEKLEPTAENLPLIDAIVTAVGPDSYDEYRLHPALGKLLSKILDEEYGEREVVEDRLLELGAMVSVIGENGRTPITNTRLPERWRKYALHPSGVLQVGDYYNRKEISAFDVVDKTGSALIHQLAQEDDTYLLDALLQITTLQPVRCDVNVRQDNPPIGWSFLGHHMYTYLPNHTALSLAQSTEFARMLLASGATLGAYPRYNHRNRTSSHLEIDSPLSIASSMALVDLFIAKMPEQFSGDALQKQFSNAFIGRIYQNKSPSEFDLEVAEKLLDQGISLARLDVSGEYRNPANDALSDFFRNIIRAGNQEELSEEYGVSLIRRAFEAGYECNTTKYLRKLIAIPMTPRTEALATILVENGADLNAHSLSETTASGYTAGGRRFSNGATSYTLVHEAIKSGSADNLRFALKHGGSLVTNRYHAGSRQVEPVYLAVELDNNEMLEIILNELRDTEKYSAYKRERVINEPGYHSFSPISKASQNGNLQAVFMLADEGVKESSFEPHAALACAASLNTNTLEVEGHIYYHKSHFDKLVAMLERSTRFDSDGLPSLDDISRPEMRNFLFCVQQVSKLIQKKEMDAGVTPPHLHKVSFSEDITISPLFASYMDAARKATNNFEVPISQDTVDEWGMSKTLVLRPKSEITTQQAGRI